MLRFPQCLNPSRKPSPQRMCDVLIKEAERLAIEHNITAEKCATDAKIHRILADMYAARVKRLQAKG